MIDKEWLEEIMDAIAYLRDEYVDTEMVSEYYGHDIKAEIFSCPISALSYTGDYIELLQKRVQELENRIADDEHFVAEILEQNKRYRVAIRECIERMNEGGAGTRSFVYEKLSEALEGEK